MAKLLHFAGFRYWPASLLPALVGTTLPFWLRPPGFTFRWLAAGEFLLATVLIHSGFSFLHAWFAQRAAATSAYSGYRLLTCAGTCIALACLLGFHINNCLQLNKNVYGNIFIVYGLSVLFVGVLYVVPPLNFSSRIGGEIIISESLGMLPVLGAYVIQAGDITRTVYLASIPLVIATGLWVWIDKLSSRTEDEKGGRETMVMLFSPRFSGRYIVLALVLLLFVSIVLAILSASIHPLALIALLSAGVAWKILTISWNGYFHPERMLKVRKKAYVLYFVICMIIGVSPLTFLLTGCIPEQQGNDITPPGLVYQLQELDQPRPNRVHILRLDLDNTSYQLSVATGVDPDGDGPIEATLEDPFELAGDQSVVAFINANPWESFPDSTGKKNQTWYKGQPVDIYGYSVSDGQERSPAKPAATSVWIDRDGRVAVGNTPGDSVAEAITGFNHIVRNGAVSVPAGGEKHPRTAIGIDGTGSMVWLVVVDGRQKGYSEGMDLYELGSLMVDLGCWDAVNMDGGGSSIMGLADGAGKLQLINSPSNRRLGIKTVRPLPNILMIRGK